MQLLKFVNNVAPTASVKHEVFYEVFDVEQRNSDRKVSF